MNRKAILQSTVIAVAALVSTNPLAADLANQIQPLIAAHDGEVGVAITHLPTGQSYNYRENEPMPTASLIKFPVMIATYQAIADGKLSLEQPVTLTAADKILDTGTLSVDFSAGTTCSLHDTIRLMIVYSENTATNLVADRIGLRTTAELMEQIGCPNTKLHSKVTLRSTSVFPERSKQFGLGSTSAAEMVKLFTALHNGELVSQSACEQMKKHLYACADRSMCARNLPRDTNFAHKSGAVSAVRTNAGIIDSPSGPIAICVLTAKNEDRSWTNDNEAQVLCGNIARVAYDYFNTDSTVEDSKQVKPLAIGASGHLVEALQRTLNAQMPSLDIGVDGDFGPQTEGAIKVFQRAKNLPETGQVDKQTWDALGALVTADPNQPPPAEINQQIIEKAPSDPLTGILFVTCKAWAIGDAATGKLLWGHNQGQPLDMSSTTKIMTAYLVSTIAESTPETLDQELIFSQRANDTIGSTTGIRAGEKISVGELLYGLLLPSGNDASVALAEHFGDRLTTETAEPLDGYQRFVAAMNRQAKEIGMKNSSFANTHGLTAKGHRSSAQDLLLLAHHAMQRPLLQKIVSTVQHGTTVTGPGPGGYQRNLVWRNTNRLLRTEGYHGIKTGTTSAAGSCLVSQGSREDRSLIVVVLGSSSTAARYADSRNLYRWAWQQLGADE